MSETFTELPIKDGIGPYHVNQFRVHFSVPDLSGPPQAHVPKLASEFIRFFPGFFNGTEKGLTHNRALVGRMKDKHGTKETLKFVMDFKSESTGIDLPDIHSDWVAVEWKDPNRGFAAQTLKRDLHWYEPLQIPFPLANIFKHFNSYHFLAGRRSWVFGVMDPTLPGWASKKLVMSRVEGNKVTPYTGPLKPVFFLETAAVERYSVLAYKLMEYDKGRLFLDIRKAIVDIWSILLANYVAAKGFRLNTGLPTAWIHDNGDNLWSKSPMRGVYYRQQHHDSDKTVLSTQWIQHLYSLHPALANQQLTETRSRAAGGFQGFGGGSGGGGGAGGHW